MHSIFNTKKRKRFQLTRSVGSVTIHIHPSCVNVIKEIQQWRWRVDEKSGEYTDEPVNVFDDAMAALRYGVESWRKDKKAKIYSREEYGI